MAKMHVKKGDRVLVITGKWKGEEARIRDVISSSSRVVLEISSLSPAKQSQIGRRTIKKSQDNPQGGLIERSVSVHVSNVKLLDKKGKGKKASEKAGKPESSSKKEKE